MALSCGKKNVIWGLGGLVIGAAAIFVLKKLGVMAGIQVAKRPLPRAYR